MGGNLSEVGELHTPPSWCQGHTNAQYPLLFYLKGHSKPRGGAFHHMLLPTRTRSSNRQCSKPEVTDYKSPSVLKEIPTIGLKCCLDHGKSTVPPVALGMCVAWFRLKKNKGCWGAGCCTERRAMPCGSGGLTLFAALEVRPYDAPGKGTMRWGWISDEFSYFRRSIQCFQVNPAMNWTNRGRSILGAIHIGSASIIFRLLWTLNWNSKRKPKGCKTV